MTYQGWNFRATPNLVVDAATDTYDLGTAYPTSRVSRNFGWSVNNTGNSRDRGGGYDSRISGLVFAANTTPADWKADLPSTGVATIRLAAGDMQGASKPRIQLLDGDTVFATINGDIVASQFLDATGVVRSEATVSGWPGVNAAITHTFVTTTFIVRCGDGVSSGITALAHVGFDMAGAPAGATVNLAISNLASAGTLSTGAATVTPPVAGVKNLAISNLASVGTLSTVAATVTPAQGTLTSDVFAAWGSPAPLAALSVPRVVALKMSDGTVALNLANQVTNGAGRIVLVNAALVAGTWYMLGTWNADGSARGLKAYQAS